MTLLLLDELARSPTGFRSAVEDVRARVIQERGGRRKVMLERLERVNAGKLEKRLQSVGAALEEAADGAVAQGTRRAIAQTRARPVVRHG